MNLSKMSNFRKSTQNNSTWSFVKAKIKTEPFEDIPLTSKKYEN